MRTDDLYEGFEPEEGEKDEVGKICDELRRQQYGRRVALRFRIRVMNGLVAAVANTMGYDTRAEEKVRKALFDKVATLVAKFGKADKKGEPTPEELDHVADLIRATLVTAGAYDTVVSGLDASMTKLVKQLPIRKWIEEDAQYGVGHLGVAQIIGEAGDLRNYSNPGKLWRRMGCAPYQKEEHVLMGATWKGNKGKKGEPTLTKAEWEDFGYCPRRRSLLYLMGESLVKTLLQEYKEEDKDGNPYDEEKLAKEKEKDRKRQASPYRRRLQQAKETAAEKHPDWTPGHCHNHGLLLMEKLVLKHLWIRWNKDLGVDIGEVPEGHSTLYV